MTQPYCKLEPGDIWQAGDGFFDRTSGEFHAIGSHIHGKPFTYHPDLGPYFRPVPPDEGREHVRELLSWADSVTDQTVTHGITRIPGSLFSRARAYLAR